ncbi:MAG: HAMP domain-containing protein [Chthonomonas sp.]|nr:HAMP domain-containing protein [Chthonomonas sp.]
MSWFQNLKVGKKLAIGFATGIIGIGLLGSMSLKSARQGADAIQDVADNHLVPSKQLRDISDAYAVSVVDASHKARNGGMTYDESLKAMQAAKELIDKEWKLIENSDPELLHLTKAEFDELKQLKAAADQATEESMGFLKAGDQAGLASFTIRDMYPKIDPFTGKIGEAVNKITAGALSDAKAEGDALPGMLARIVAIGFGVALISALIGWFISNSITKPLAALGKTAEGISQGDLNQSITYSAKDETGQLANSFRNMVAYLKESAGNLERVSAGDLSVSVNPRSSSDQFGIAQKNMVASLRDIVNALKGKAAETGSTGQDLALATDQTARSVQEIAHTIAEVATATDESAQTTQRIASMNEDLARLVNDAVDSTAALTDAINEVRTASTKQSSAASEASDAAKEGGKAFELTSQCLVQIQDQVQTSVVSVQDLGRKQEQIGAIVETIQEIAEQTNLLALNAAIEAARAGEHGRGFAVVADEVRRLAERAGHATKEIAELIENVRIGVNTAVAAMDATVAEVDRGAQQSQAIESSYARILETIDQVRTISIQSDQLVRSMADDAARVNNVIESVGEISQSNAAATQELSAMTEEMSASAQEVSSNVQNQNARVAEMRTLADKLLGTSTELDTVVSQFNLDTTPTQNPNIRLAA